MEPPKSAESQTVIEWPLDKNFLQKNIDRSIEFRKEYYKYTIAIATALLAFTISFPPNLIKTAHAELIFLAWISLGVAVISAVLAHDLWSRFFISWRNYDNKKEKGKGDEFRAKITFWRRRADIVQLAALAIGVGCVVVFAGINIGNVAPKEPSASAAGSQDASEAVSSSPARPNAKALPK